MLTTGRDSLSAVAERVFSHDGLLATTHAADRLPTRRWHIGYPALSDVEPGAIRVTRAVVAVIVADHEQARARMIADYLSRGEFYEDALANTDGTVPRMHLDGQFLVVDERHVAGDSDVIGCIEPDTDGRYRLGLGHRWYPVDPRHCTQVHTGTDETAELYRRYVACFGSATQALLDLANRAGIAVAYLDRQSIETERGASLTDEQWHNLAEHLDRYHEHVSGIDDGQSNSVYLDQVYDRAGVARHPEVDTR